MTRLRTRMKNHVYMYIYNKTPQTCSTPYTTQRYGSIFYLTKYESTLYFIFIRQKLIQS